MSPGIVCIQEINIRSAFLYFQDYFQVIVNKDDNQNEDIGIITLVSRKYNIEQNIIAANGRIIGTKLRQCQIWNVYPISGANHKQTREKFFREELIHYMMNWKDSTRFIVQAGDHNCTFRDMDSLNNPGQHKQAGFIAEMKIMGLKDAFIQVYGENKVEYSRITRNSGTRIDLILSNMKECESFEYIDMKMGFDHKMARATFDINIEEEREMIPSQMRFNSIAISKDMETNKTFLEITQEKIEEIYQRYLVHCNEDSEVDVSLYWKEIKTTIKEVANAVCKYTKKEEEKKLKSLEVKYMMGLMEEDTREDKIQEIKKQLNEVYNTRSKAKIDKMRGLEIQDHMYDIKKLQRERK